ncbi:hypothetical protein QJS04_geneDACA008022 [Acorus gramineus]|uniref:Disease resistance N-terminal domain-containing protein n=1 Tax=Acorus gramineus TaxID=55184 RepID=A0AAV9B8T0_ACOGR|nr:hypothetical protein QJS04_geneDACA008022 [Acorus gramineus]
MIGFLDVAERREHKDEDVMAWMNRLRRLFYDIEDAIDDFHVDINNTGTNCFFSFHMRRRSRILKRIRAIHADLKLISTDQSQHLSLAPGKSKGDAFVVLPDEEATIIVGIDGEIDGLWNVFEGMVLEWFGITSFYQYAHILTGICGRCTLGLSLFYSGQPVFHMYREKKP